ncbi:LAETG motif-containing sortase-dependent surface protein [Streptomyces lanatus]|uniref:LAETG motif-containing sortase-dependent surface protein n=1 Tax=Streptomyces lanatus TaxID=66900 RepID=A0ABV1Y5X1_9ACTN|nr:LAETG motif-containing sortase-dependent surface protein [Streptomyces lanatus]
MPTALLPQVRSDVAETDASSSTPSIAGIAAALVIAGGGTLSALRRRAAHRSHARRTSWPVPHRGRASAGCGGAPALRPARLSNARTSCCTRSTELPRRPDCGRSRPCSCCGGSSCRPTTSTQMPGAGSPPWRCEDAAHHRQLTVPSPRRSRP